MSNLIHLQVRNPKDDETPIEAATQIFSSLLLSHISWWKAFFGRPQFYSFEIYLLNQTVYFYLTAAKSAETYLKSLLTSSFPNSAIAKTKDPLDQVLKSAFLSIGELTLSSYFYLPIKTYRDFKDIDPLSSLLGFLSRAEDKQTAAVQILISPASFAWQDKTASASSVQVKDETSGRFTQHPQKILIARKSSFQGGKATIRILSGNKDKQSTMSFLSNLAGTFGAFSLGEGNRLVFQKPSFFKKKLLDRMLKRETSFFERRYQILNSQELSSLWHPPGYLLAGIKNIAWGKTWSGEPPEDLPIVPKAPEVKESDVTSDGETSGVTTLHPRGGRMDSSGVDEIKQDINFFAKTEFKNEEQIFGIKTADRRKHVYIIGKTGAGKTTLIANMAIDDIRRGRGVGIIDPHGDLSQILLDFIPKRRVNDVVYLEPFDTERPFRLNVLETKNPPAGGPASGHKDLIASGIVTIFYKLYHESWGPRLEYILRNVILTLLEVEGTTLADVLPLLADKNYRQKIVNKVKDPVIKAFWEKEFARMPDRLRSEAISPIQNKVGQFVSSRMIRNIINHAKSTVDLAEIMNQGKILILNLAQGKLGEDNAALLGAMIITQIQLAAMGRSYVKEEERRDFFLFVDEFQNFATLSFIKILSEARKYRLSLTLANQYIEQLDPPIQKAIFGNIGTLVSFVVGARDAYLLSKEFGELYSENDLVSLGRYEIVLKLSVEGKTSSPFPAKTLPLPSLRNENREKIIRLSKERYGRQAK